MGLRHPVSKETKRNSEKVTCVFEISSHKYTHIHIYIFQMFGKYSDLLQEWPKETRRDLEKNDLCTSKETCMHLQKRPVYLRGDQKRREETQRK